MVQAIPKGQVCTYGQVAVLAGSPGAARQVGWVMAGLSESESEYVPWQRVINAQGKISIRNRGTMADLQRALLQSEGIEFQKNDSVDLTRFQYGMV